MFAWSALCSGLMVGGSLWCLKLCILDFYSRFVDVLRYGKLATTILWWFIVITFVTVLVITLTECQPLSQ